MEQLANVTTSITRWMHRRDDDGTRPLRLSSPGQQAPSSHDAVAVRNAECHSEICRYFNALEKCLFWEDCYSAFVNVYVFILFNAAVWAYNGLREPIGMPQISFGITVHFIIQVMIVYKFSNIRAPTDEHPRPCSRFHSVWKKLRQLRNEQREIYCFLLCSLALCVWLVDRMSSSSNRYIIYWSIIFAPPVLRLPLRISEMITAYLRLHGDWRHDSDIEEEFLPVVTEANLQVLNRVGETGDRSPSPTPTSALLWDDLNGPLNDEDLVEGLDIPSHEDGSTDGVELSELELSVSENDAEETGIIFQTRHFENSSSSSSEEDVFDSNIIAVSSDESNSDNDFEIIDKEEVAHIKM